MGLAVDSLSVYWVLSRVFPAVIFRHKILGVALIPEIVVELEHEQWKVLYLLIRAKLNSSVMFRVRASFACVAVFTPKFSRQGVVSGPGMNWKICLPERLVV